MKLSIIYLAGSLGQNQDTRLETKVVQFDYQPIEQGIMAILDEVFCYCQYVSALCIEHPLVVAQERAPREGDLIRVDDHIYLICPNGGFSLVQLRDQIVCQTGDHVVITGTNSVYDGKTGKIVDCSNVPYFVAINDQASPKQNFFEPHELKLVLGHMVQK